MPLPKHLARKNEFLHRLDNEPALLEAIETMAKMNNVEGVSEVLINAGIDDALVHLRGEEPATKGLASAEAKPPRCCIYFGEFICVCWH